MSVPIRVLCVDDSRDITEMYRSFIDEESDMCCVGMLGDAAALVAEVERTGATVVLLDLTMPGPDPLGVVRQLNEVRPDVRVLAFSGYDDESTVTAALDAGAWGLVSKHGRHEEVLTGLRRIAAGEVVMPGRN